MQILYFYPELKNIWQNNIIKNEEISLLEEKQEIEDESVFALEKYLQEFIVSNWNSIDGLSEYTIVEDMHGNRGQYPAGDCGKIDILAKDKQGNYIIIELKRSQSDDDTVGQVLRYMGWVKKHLFKDQKGKVKGMIISNSISLKMQYALEGSNADIALKKYTIQFNLNDFQ